MGSTEATGILHSLADSHSLVVIVHGLGSGPDASYVRAATDHCLQAGLSVLRLSFRGADEQAADFYNAALTRDLHVAMACPSLEQFTRRFVLGFSLGGHMALRFATETEHPAMHAVAAICPPLDLKGCQIALDAPRFNVYRDHCLKGLRRTVRAAAKRASEMGVTLPVDLNALNSIKTIYAWDDQVVAPRFGYGDADDYYAQCSAGPRLSGLRRPSLVVAAQFDPMVPIETLRPYFDAPDLTVTTPTRGGHVGFPSDLNLGFQGKRGLIAQTLTWLQEQVAPTPSARSAPDVSLAGYGRSWRPK